MTDDRPDWHEYFMAVAKLISTRSTCNSRPRDRHILATGYNGSPPGAPHCRGNFNADGSPFCYSRHMGTGDADKYNYCRSIHAEANAITKVAKSANNCDGATLYITASPCMECSKLIIQAGIKRVVYCDDYHCDDGIESHDAGQQSPLDWLTIDAAVYCGIMKPLFRPGRATKKAGRPR